MAFVLKYLESSEPNGELKVVDHAPFPELSGQVTLAVPDWIYSGEDVGRIWTGNSLNIEVLGDAVDELVARYADGQDAPGEQEEVASWRVHGSTRVDVDLAIPLLLLARTLHDMGRQGALMLEAE